jgi:hypothetical protein
MMSVSYSAGKDDQPYKAMGRNILLSSASNLGKNASSSASFSADNTSCGEMVFLPPMCARSLELAKVSALSSCEEVIRSEAGVAWHANKAL